MIKGWIKEFVDKLWITKAGYFHYWIDFVVETVTYYSF